MEEIQQKRIELFERLDITPRSQELWKQVFLHRSYLNEHPNETTFSNERLEFLGDAVLELITTEALYQMLPNEPEGALTSLRAALVKGEHLAQVARQLGLGMFLFMSKGEQMSNGADKDYILANTFEALLGAIYLEHGYGKATDIVTRFVLVDLEKIVEASSHIDSKSKLQEMAQERFGITPHYALLSEEGPDHSKSFCMGVYLGEELLAEGRAPSKRKGEEDAAHHALHIPGWL